MEEIRITDEVFTGKEIATIFKVSNSTVNLWKRSGMPHYGKSSCARFKKDEVAEWLKLQSSIAQAPKVTVLEAEEAKVS